MLTRRQLLGTIVAGTAASVVRAAARIDPAYRLIAHRGGVVDDQHAENSPGSLQAAIDRGYWMIEVDIRRTRDGELVLQHDPDFRRFYGNPARVEDLTWAEVSQLRAQPGGTHPIHFRDVCKMCQGKVRLMLDLKLRDAPASYYRGVADLLAAHDLLRTTYLLGGGGASTELASRCFRSSNRKELREAIARGEDVKSRYFLFELASDIDAETLDLCRKSGVAAVAAINTFRYTMAKRDEWKGPQEDAAHLRELGVRYYQIDSMYESFFYKS